MVQCDNHICEEKIQELAAELNNSKKQLNGLREQQLRGYDHDTIDSIDTIDTLYCVAGLAACAFAAVEVSFRYFKAA